MGVLPRGSMTDCLPNMRLPVLYLSLSQAVNWRSAQRLTALSTSRQTDLEGRGFNADISRMSLWPVVSRLLVIMCYQAADVKLMTQRTPTVAQTSGLLRRRVAPPCDWSAAHNINTHTHTLAVGCRVYQHFYYSEFTAERFLVFCVRLSVLYSNVCEL